MVTKLVSVSTGRKDPALLEQQPPRRLSEDEVRELRMLQLFRDASTSVQKEIIELLEFKSNRREGAGEAQTQPDTASRRGRFQAVRPRRPPK
jgi:hypothetical protein